MKTIHIFIQESVFSSKTIDFIKDNKQGEHFYYFDSKKKPSARYDNLLKTETDLLNEIKKGEINIAIFHSLHYFQFKLLDKIIFQHPTKITISWIFWSFEYYQLNFNIHKLYDDFSNQFATRKRISLWVENFLYFLKRKTASPFPISAKKYQNQISKVDYFYSFVFEDYKLIYRKNTKTVYKFISYLNLNNLQNNNFIKQLDSTTNKKIMIGHSGTPLGNHMEAYSIVRSITNTAEIVIPLSYGKKEYITKLKNKIEFYKDKSVVFLLDFLPLQEYNQLLSAIDYFILNSFCQQALGNIVHFLYNGTAIYLSEKSSTYEYLKRIGIVVFSIENLAIEKTLKCLSAQEINNNKEIIANLISTENFKHDWNLLLSGNSSPTN